MAKAERKKNVLPEEEVENGLPPLPPDHGFREGDEVSMRIHGGAEIRGKVVFINVPYGRKRRLRGLVVLGTDNRYYELIPEAKKIGASPATPRKSETPRTRAGNSPGGTLSGSGGTDQ